jgi:4-hydroxybenzoate polyprenyltransferase
MAVSAELAPSADAGPPQLPLTPRPRHLARELVLLARLNRPIGIFLLLWPTLWALWVAAGGIPATRLLCIFVLGTVVMRSAGCAINDVLDRHVDPHVRRTRDRPLAARRLSPYTALGFVLALLAVALLLALQLNLAALKLAVAGALLTLTYPFFKRFFPVPQLYLGLCFGWGIPMAFAATLGFVPRAGWLLLLAAVLWAGVYDTFYAMADRSDDQRIGVRSSAISFGDMDLTMIGVMQTMVIFALLLTGLSLDFGFRYFAALLLAAAFFAWQLWQTRKRDRESCLRAFQHNNYVGLIVFVGVVAQFS